MKKIKSQILMCSLEQKCHRDFFEVRWSLDPKRHTKYKRPRQTINNVDMLIFIEEHLRPTRKTWARNLSGHALMGRLAARLEMIALVISSYVLVCIVVKIL